MSHSVEIKVEAKVENEEELIEALTEHFGVGNVELHNTPQMLMTYSGVPSGTKANIIVRRAAQEKKARGGYLLVNDLGFIRQNDGTYKMSVDEAGFPASKREVVFQNMSGNIAARKLKARGYRVTRELQEDGVLAVLGEKR
jgi:hypothetical protein